MLFSYTYVPHAMEKMQVFIDFIFYEVWCKAPIGLSFNLELFEKEQDLREVLSSFGFAANAPKRGKQFYKDIKAIYELFSQLTPEQIDQLKLWYQANNDIEKVCANDPTVQIVRYTDIVSVYPDLSKQLASFFKGLYVQDLLNLKALRNKIGEIDAHYQAFMQVNTGGKCPFCGLNDVKGVYHTKREAYDHYLPKSLYPFNSINFRNLAPACHECNSTYKLSKDPVHNAAGRRKTFYPYTASAHDIEIVIALSTPDIDRLTPADIQFTFGPAAAYEEIETWKDVYGIEERYKAKCCGENDGKYWMTQILDEYQDDGKTPADYMATLTRQASRYPFSESNFLKTAFLEGCYRSGIFDVIAMETDVEEN